MDHPMDSGSDDEYEYEYHESETEVSIESIPGVMALPLTLLTRPSI